MYSRKHGKSGSTKPARKNVPNWVRYDSEETEKLVVKLAKDGHESADIGRILRDRYGIPSVKEITNKSITDIMQENDLYPDYPEDMFNLMKKAVRVMDHLDEHNHDPIAIRGLELTESKIRRLGKYYKFKGVLPADWKYDREQTKLLVK